MTEIKTGWRSASTLMRSLNERRKLILAVGMAYLIITLLMIFYSTQINLFLINARAGCFPWSPREVHYHPGMTLCPGQSIHLELVLPGPPYTDEKGKI